MANPYTPNPKTAPEETQDSQQPGFLAKAKALYRKPGTRKAIVAAVLLLLAAWLLWGGSGESQDSTTTPAEKSSVVSSGKQQEPLLVQGVVKIVNVKGEVVMEITMNSAKLHELSEEGEIVPRRSQKWNTDLKQSTLGQRRLHQAIFNTVCPDGADHPELEAFGLCN